MSTYDIGDTAILVAVVSKNAAPFSGSGTMRVRVPGAVDVAEVAASESPAGTYTAAFGPITVSGRHYYRFQVEGADAGAEEKWFDVRPRKV